MCCRNERGSSSSIYARLVQDRVMYDLLVFDHQDDKGMVDMN